MTMEEETRQNREDIRKLVELIIQHDRQAKDILVCSEKILESVRDLKNVQEAHNDILSKTLELQYVTQTQIKQVVEIVSDSAKARESFYQNEIRKAREADCKDDERDKELETLKIKNAQERNIKWIAIASTIVTGIVSITIIILQNIL